MIIYSKKDIEDMRKRIEDKPETFLEALITGVAVLLLAGLIIGLALMFV